MYYDRSHLYRFVSQVWYSDVKQFDSFAQKCAPAISTDTLKALVKTESSFNPYAIGVVNGSIAQPKTFDEAIKAVEQLEAEGKNYSIGLGQINKHNFNRRVKSCSDPVHKKGSYSANTWIFLL